MVYNPGKSILGQFERAEKCVNHVGVHRAKNPSRVKSVQAVVNQQPNVPVNQSKNSCP